MIELRLKFQLEKPELPKAMEKVMVSFFKASLENYSEQLFQEIYSKNKRNYISAIKCIEC